MTLADALANHHDAVVCDLAETYHVFDYQALPVPLLAALVFGLRPDSRYRQELNGINPTSSHVLLANIADTLMLISAGLGGAKLKDEDFWTNSVIAREEKKKEVRGFNSGQDFMNEWRRMSNG